MSENKVISKQKLLNDTQEEWANINQFLDSLSDEQWTDIKNSDGWAIKDHVAHLSAWEQSMIAFLTSVPRHEGLGIPKDVYLSEDFDAMNDVIFQQHQHDSLEQVRSNFATTHQTLLEHIEKLSEDDLQKPYVHYLPFEPGEGDGPPAIQSVYSNTANHYCEHMPWMKEMLGID